jgi:hypothetical protein
MNQLSTAPRKKVTIWTPILSLKTTASSTALLEILAVFLCCSLVRRGFGLRFRRHLVTFLRGAVLRDLTLGMCFLCCGGAREIAPSKAATQPASQVLPTASAAETSMMVDARAGKAVADSPLVADSLCTAMKSIEAIAKRELSKDDKATGKAPDAQAPFAACSIEKPGPLEMTRYDPAFYACSLAANPSQFGFVAGVFESCFANELALARKSKTDNNRESSGGSWRSFDLVVNPKEQLFRYRSCKLSSENPQSFRFSCGFHHGD